VAAWLSQSRRPWTDCLLERSGPIAVRGGAGECEWRPQEVATTLRETVQDL